MADYPKFPILDTSTIEEEDGYEEKRASNGALKVRKTMSTEKRNFNIDHVLNKTDYEALETFFQSNKEANVTLYWPGDAGTYTVRFVARPLRQQQAGYFYRVRVRVKQV